MKLALAQYDGATTLRVLPLAAGLLASTLRRAPDLADVPVTIQRRRVDPDLAADALVGHDLIGLSLYTWNERYTLEVARRLRARSPAALIVAGGPSVPRRPDDVARLFAEHPALDALVAGEGERAFLEVVRAHRDGRPLETVPGVAVRPASGHHLTARGPRLVGADFASGADAPALVGSPYLDGTFDALLADPLAPPIGGAVFETNRGCPFSCTFCDWGQAIESRVPELPMERVVAELAWAAAQKVPFLYFIDANFGIRKRDIDIVRALGDIAIATGFPRFVFFHLTKNATEKNLATVEALRDAGIGTQVSLSMQDFDPDVLAAIRRDNIHPERALELRARCHALGLPTNNELMLGLPAQTAAGFRRSLVQAMTPFAGDAFFLYMTRALVNAELADPAYRARWGLVLREVPSLPRLASDEVYVVERELVVVGSDAMPVAEWRTSYAFGYLFAALVNQGLLATTLRLLAFVLHADVVALVDALLAAATPILAAIRTSLLGFADAVLAGLATTLPLDGYGPTRREPVEAVCALALGAPHDAFADEVMTALAPHLPSEDRALVREAIAWDALHLPRHGARARDTTTFTRDWWDWSPSEGRLPAPARFVVHRTPFPWAAERAEVWLDTFVSLGWSKTPRTLVERAAVALTGRR
ncbi:MAG: radical SAM protein [Deltaproteobacteria bacterium]|nr:radical SAM protein [Deltaproteobacteria bacterium]